MLKLLILRGKFLGECILLGLALMKLSKSLIRLFVIGVR